MSRPEPPRASTATLVLQLELSTIADELITPPADRQTLYHYTDTHGLLGILRDASSAELWATDYRFLNDSSELEYAFDVLHRVASDLRAEHRHSATAQSLLHAVDDRAALQGGSSFYLACFCEQKNLLNQWRAYGGKDGYCLGFEVSGMIDHTRGSGPDEVLELPSYNHFLAKVIYDPAEQAQRLTKMLEPLVRHVRAHEAAGGTGTGLGNGVQYVFPFIMGLLLTFKNPAFAVEHEWRLVHILGPRDAHGHVKYRSGKYGITPYVELCLAPRRGRFEGRLPLVSVMHGPSADAQVARRVLRALLDARGYTIETTAAESSDLPLRF